MSASSRTNVWAVGITTVGSSVRTLTLHWNGKRWSRIDSPDQGAGTSSQLYGVSVLSATNAWAVGTLGVGGAVRSLILHWNGTHWTRVGSPDLDTNTELFGVSARSPGDPWAVGVYADSAGGHPLAVHCC